MVVEFSTKSSRGSASASDRVKVQSAEGNGGRILDEDLRGSATANDRVKVQSAEENGGRILDEELARFSHGE
jgi:hypothetical protein